MKAKTKRKAAPKRRKAREWWIVRPEYSIFLYSEVAKVWKANYGSSDSEIIHVKEVLPRRKK